MKKKHFNDHALLSIAVIVAIVVVVSLIFNNSGNIHGAPTYPGNEQFIEPDPVIVDESESVVICFQEDEGENDFYTKSYVQITTRKYYDFCQGDFVRETHCNGLHEKVVSNARLCEFGCEQGACLRQRTYGTS